MSETKVKKILHKRQVSLSQLCASCGISRQSLYAMFKGASVFNVPFTKLVKQLGINPADITTEVAQSESILKSAPLKVQKVALKLTEFCQKNMASLILFGSRVRGVGQASSDWDFGVFFQENEKQSELKRLKQKLLEEGFPYRFDIVLLNQAPAWFWESIQNEFLLLSGRKISKLEDQT